MFPFRFSNTNRFFVLTRILRIVLMQWRGIGLLLESIRFILTRILRIVLMQWRGAGLLLESILFILTRILRIVLMQWRGVGSYSNRFFVLTLILRIVLTQWGGWALTRYDSYFITNLEEHLKYRDYYRMIRSNSSEYAQSKLISRPNFLPVACR